MKPEDIIKPYISLLEQDLKTLVIENENELKDDVLGFLFAPSKRLRPVFTYLCSFALKNKPSGDIQKIALALELLHSATLVHDDILDESMQRRGRESFYSKFGAKRAVIAGDYLLSLCFKVLSELKHPDVFKIFSSNILKTINGEINQFNTRFQISSKEEYFRKTSAKTANLFVCAAQSVCSILGTDEYTKNVFEDFALGFGTVFQMRNDIKDFSCSKDDIENGIYTLCAIYFKQDNPSCDIIDLESNKAALYIKKAADETDKIAQDTADVLNRLKDGTYDLSAVDMLKNLCLNI